MARRTKPRRKFFSARLLQASVFVLLLLGLLGLAGGLLVGFVRMAWQEHQINRAIAQQQSQNAQQAERNRRLKGQADYAESDVAAEQIARERLGMAREGETVLLPTVVLPPMPTPQPSGEPTATPVLAESTSDSNTARWFRALFPGPDALP